MSHHFTTIAATMKAGLAQINKSSVSHGTSTPSTSFPSGRRQAVGQDAEISRAQAVIQHTSRMSCVEIESSIAVVERSDPLAPTGLAKRSRPGSSAWGRNGLDVRFYVASRFLAFRGRASILGGT